MSAVDDFKRVEPTERARWRAWLEENHASSPGAWLVCRKAGSGLPTVSYDEAVEEALCFGWVDSKVRSIDERSYMQMFTPRKPGSHWSRSNKRRVARLEKQGLIAAAGLAAIEAAKEDGSWTFLDPIEDLVVPDDLAAALAQNAKAKRNYEAFSDSSKKGILLWIATAKREGTRAKRVAETIRLAAQNKRANHPDD